MIVMCDEMSAASAFWYLVRVYSGSEDSVVLQIKANAKLRKVDKYFADFFCPKVVIDRPSGKKGSKTLYPGYLAVKMVMNEITSNLVREIPKVVEFLGNGKNPKPLSEAEMQKMFEGVTKSVKASETVAFSVGESVKIKTGSFAGFKGNIISVSDDKKTLTVLIPVFNTETEMSFAIADVEKLVV